MKSIVAIILSILLFHGAYAQRPNYLPDQKVKGKVKVIEEYVVTTDESKNPPAESLLLTHIIKYNKKSQITEEYKQDQTTGLADTANKYLYTYNKKGDMTEIAIISKTDTFLQKIINKYDTKGKLVSASMERKEDNTVTLLKYDSKKRVTELQQGNNGIRNQYDNNGNLTERSSIENGEEKTAGKLSFSYDDKNQITEQRMEKVIIRYDYDNYDKEGNWQKVSASFGHNTLRAAKPKAFNVTIRKITYY